MNNHRIALLAAALLAAAAPASAAPIATYLDNAFVAGDITNNNDSLAHSYVASNVTASALTKSIANDSDAAFSTATGTYFAKATVTPASGTSNALTFSVGAQEGYTLSLTSLTFNFGGSHSVSSSTTYIANAALYYSFDNFATAGTLVGSTDNTALTLPASPAMNLGYAASLDLTSFAGLTSSQPISFRLYFTDNSTSGNVSLRVDDIALNGTVASQIPEPSAYALVSGALALGLVGTRRHLRRIPVL